MATVYFIVQKIEYYIVGIKMVEMDPPDSYKLNVSDAH